MSNGYHANFQAYKLRPSGRKNSIRFAAASDGAASSVVTELENWTVGQNTSLTKNVYANFRGYGASYALGTIYGFTAVVWDSLGNSWRVRFRNILALTPGLDMVGAITHLLMGQADADYGLAALSGPPVLPNTGNPVAFVTGVTYITKP